MGADDVVVTLVGIFGRRSGGSGWWRGRHLLRDERQPWVVLARVLEHAGGGMAANMWCGARGCPSARGVRSGEISAPDGEARNPRPDLRDLGRVVGGGVGQDRGKPLASGSHDVVDALGVDSLLGGFVEVPSTSPPNPLPWVKILVPAWAVVASRCRSPS
jgi:hypothetical protein